jgi:hypothetical protein
MYEYSSPNINKEDDNVSACRTQGRDVSKVLVGNAEGKRPLERAWRRWEGNMKMDLEARTCKGIHMEGSCGSSNKPRELHKRMSDYQIPKEDSAPWS